jgi:hypothetical protein
MAKAGEREELMATVIAEVPASRRLRTNMHFTLKENTLIFERSYQGQVQAAELDPARLRFEHGITAFGHSITSPQA